MAGCYSSVAEFLYVKQVVLGLIPGGDQMFLTKKVCERERIHLRIVLLNIIVEKLIDLAHHVCAEAHY